ncbi:MAG: ChuX/HutX family heme-like substrate-binding protein [Bacteroidota bacterium]
MNQAAEQLNVSEAELLAAHIDGKKTIRLTNDFKDLFKAIERLGYVMALTRNNSVVHERKGEYHKISFDGHVGLVLDPNIDLRIFINRFSFAYATQVETPKRTLRSIQFFDEFGTAVHKIYLMNEEHIETYHQVVSEFTAEDQTPEVHVQEGAAEEPTYESEIDESAFLEDWANLQDTHDFYPLLRKYKVERTHALEIAEGRFATKISNTKTREMLEKASERQVPIMVFVSSRGVIQIHSGEVNKIKVMDNWLNVLDPEFNLHLREDHIAHSWIVEKPTEDGIVTSLEIFDADRKNIATFFGARKPGKPELDSWKSLANDLLTREEELA